MTVLPIAISVSRNAISELLSPKFIEFVAQSMLLFWTGFNPDLDRYSAVSNYDGTMSVKTTVKTASTNLHLF